MNKNQKGITLMEVMLVFAMTSIISGGITMTFYQVVTGSMRTNNHMIAVAQAQSAGYSVSHDAQMAQNVKSGASSGFPLTLKWTDWVGTQNVVTYTIVGGKLTRQDGTSESTVASFIDSTTAKTKCELTGGGTFTLPDYNDTFTITGGALADSGTITVVTGSISLVSTSGGATYDAGTGAWTTPAGSGTVILKAGTDSTAGVWTSAMASATVAISTDTDLDAAATGRGVIFTVTASVGGGSQAQSETRVYEIVSRAS